MEVYRVSSCNNYALDGALMFRDISVYQAGPMWSTFNLVTPSWSTQVGVLLNPNPFCSYGATATFNPSTSRSTATVTY